MITSLARILRRKSNVHSLLPDLTNAIVAIVAADWLRYDLSDDQGRIWSRKIKPGQEAERPEIGTVPRLGSKETEVVKSIEGGFEACLILGMGNDVSGRLILRRKAAPFDSDLEKLRAIADVLSLGLRSRPFEPPPKPRSPFDEGGPLV